MILQGDVEIRTNASHSGAGIAITLGQSMG